MSKLDVHFEYSFLDQTLKELENLDPKKVSQVNDIPVKVIKGSKDILASLYIISSVTHLTNKIHFLPLRWNMPMSFLFSKRMTKLIR